MRTEFAKPLGGNIMGFQTVVAAVGGLLGPGDGDRGHRGR